MKIKFFAWVMMFSLVLLPGCAWFMNQDPDAESRRVSAEGFSIVPPKGWTVSEAGEGTLMIWLDEVKDDFRANFNVNVTEGDSTTVEQLGPVVKEMFAKQFDKWQAMDEGFTEFAGEKGYFLSSRFSMQGYDIRNLQYYIYGKHNRFYVLTFTALNSNYGSYQESFKRAAASVKLLD
ncbi:MAG: hypothetical protein ACAI44_26810 [Candidatus Sericytochromatia bacterium]